MSNNEVKIAILETKIDNVSKDVKELGKALHNHTTWEEKYHREDEEKLGKMMSSLHEKIDKLDKRYSAKWVEWAIKGLYLLLGTGSVSLILYNLTN